MIPSRDHSKCSLQGIIVSALCPADKWENSDSLHNSRIVRARTTLMGGFVRKGRECRCPLEKEAIWARAPATCGLVLSSVSGRQEGHAADLKRTPVGKRREFWRDHTRVVPWEDGRLWGDAGCDRGASLVWRSVACCGKRRAVHSAPGITARGRERSGRGSSAGEVAQVPGLVLGIVLAESVAYGGRAAVVRFTPSQESGKGCPPLGKAIR